MVLRALVRRFATCVHTTLFLLAGCAAPPPASPAADDATPPWMLRRTFTTRDGRTIELEGAPGRRAIATYLQLAMERHNVSRPEDLGTELRDMPDFYVFSLQDDRWLVFNRLGFGDDWKDRDREVEPCRWYIPELNDLSLPELAMAISDVVWKWPLPPVNIDFGRPPYRVEVLGKWYAKTLRAKLDRGMPLARAWKELVFQYDSAQSELTLLDGALRVARTIPGYTTELWIGSYSGRMCLGVCATEGEVRVPSVFGLGNSDYAAEVAARVSTPDRARQSLLEASRAACGAFDAIFVIRSPRSRPSA